MSFSNHETKPANFNTFKKAFAELDFEVNYSFKHTTPFGMVIKHPFLVGIELNNKSSRSLELIFEIGSLFGQGYFFEYKNFNDLCVRWRWTPKFLVFLGM